MKCLSKENIQLDFSEYGSGLSKSLPWQFRIQENYVL